MKYNGFTNPLVHLRDFEHRMVLQQSGLRNQMSGFPDNPHRAGESVVYFPFSGPLKGRTQNAKNKSLLCDYHQGYGHKTQDCYDPKDAIEQAIRDGKLIEFVIIIREPRNSNRERPPRMESRKPNNRRDDDNPVMQVAVITGSNAV
ncbi:hypothetical protein PIB30_066750 [Stylosanthes scabra]|uniref:Uncharacterized protein n=1 Tax=Stylosanthes scabra TaxID=79078 RepID=A0ABU6WKR7_9FABA|nr:hypothetical protein [Stylosanthes scabra]